MSSLFRLHFILGEKNPQWQFSLLKGSIRPNYQNKRSLMYTYVVIQIVLLSFALLLCMWMEFNFWWFKTLKNYNKKHLFPETVSRLLWVIQWSAVVIWSEVCGLSRVPDIVSKKFLLVFSVGVGSVMFLCCEHLKQTLYWDGSRSLREIELIYIKT